MNQEKFGKIIKEIRKKNNLTQKELADKYNVTFQAVSKWENGKNMPDTSLIKQISEDFNVSIENLFDGKYINKKKNIYFIIIPIIMTIIIGILLLLLFENNDFEFKTLSSNCDNFTISGSVSYNDKKTSIYVTNIKYCGGNETTKYREIECVLYEKHNDIEKQISSYKYDDNELILLEDFLKDVTLTVEDYKQVCSEYNEDSLYLLINGIDNNGKTTSYKIPLSLNSNC